MPEVPDAVVSITIPAAAEHVVVARTAVAAAAAVAGATIDEVEDLRLAVSEACSLLLDEAAGTIGVTVRTDDGRLLLELATDGPRGGARPGSDLAWMLLEGLVDEVRWDPDAAAELTLGLVLSLHAPSRS